MRKFARAQTAEEFVNFGEFDLSAPVGFSNYLIAMFANLYESGASYEAMADRVHVSDLFHTSDTVMLTRGMHGVRGFDRDHGRKVMSWSMNTVYSSSHFSIDADPSQTLIFAPSSRERALIKTEYARVRSNNLADGYAVGVAVFGQFPRGCVKSFGVDTESTDYEEAELFVNAGCSEYVTDAFTVSAYDEHGSRVSKAARREFGLHYFNVVRIEAVGGFDDDLPLYLHADADLSPIEQHIVYVDGVREPPAPFVWYYGVEE